MTVEGVVRKGWSREQANYQAELQEIRYKIATLNPKTKESEMEKYPVGSLSASEPDKKVILTIQNRETRKPQRILDFFEAVCTGIRGEYEKGWSCRDLQEDIETLITLLKGDKEWKPEH